MKFETSSASSALLMASLRSCPRVEPKGSSARCWAPAALTGVTHDEVHLAAVFRIAKHPRVDKILASLASIAERFHAGARVVSFNAAACAVGRALHADSRGTRRGARHAEDGGQSEERPQEQSDAARAADRPPRPPVTLRPAKVPGHRVRPSFNLDLSGRVWPRPCEPARKRLAAP
jgi:hypothetical protein